MLTFLVFLAWQGAVALASYLASDSQGRFIANPAQLALVSAASLIVLGTVPDLAVTGGRNGRLILTWLWRLVTRH